MTFLVAGIPWQQSPIASRPFAAIVCDPVTDLEWQVELSGTDFGGKPVQATGVVVVNQNSGDAVTVLADAYPSIIPPYQTLTVPLLGAKRLTVRLTSKPCTIYIISDPALSQQVTNQYAIQFNEGLAIVYTTVIKAGNPETQLLTDGNKHVDFYPPVTTQSYNLLTTGLSDGFLSYVKNRNSTNRTAITPGGGNTINGLYTAANPLYLYPQDGGKLRFDGSNFDFSGSISFVSPDQTIDTLQHSIPHPLMTAPDSLEWYLRCITSELGYAVGDVLQIGTTPQSIFGGDRYAQGFNPIVDAAVFPGVINYRLGNAVIVLSQYTAVANVGLTNANWRIFFRAKKVWA
jgi:hypothetical protein